jgi:hypothetical protein
VSGAVVTLCAVGASLAQLATGARHAAASVDRLFASSFDGALLVVQENQPLPFTVAVQQINRPRSATQLFKHL